MPEIHVYVHVPFCVDACGYCDFYRGKYRPAGEKIFVEALLEEIALRIPAGSHFASLYFGGGTPSLLTAESFGAIFERFEKAGAFNKQSEISIEANPAGIAPARLREWKEFGINRVSVGVQSLNDRILKFLNRLHNRRSAIRAIERLAEAGFENISADLIYGIPAQSLKDVRRAGRRIAPLVHHLSAYALTVEQGTPFFRQGIEAISADETAEQYQTIRGTAAEFGIERYEISNFARLGHECKHNLNTWRHGHYIGLGPSAVGFDGRRRYKNAPDLNTYAKNLREERLPDGDVEVVDAGMALKERLMLGLRTREGVGLSVVERRQIRRLIGTAGLEECFEWSKNRVSLRDSSLLLMDEILSRLPEPAPPGRKIPDAQVPVHA